MISKQRFFDIPLNQEDELTTKEKLKIKELLEYDRYCRDNGHFKQMAECYSEQSFVRVSWFNGTGKEYCKRLEAAGGGGAKHKINYTIVWVNGNKAIGEMTVAMLSPRQTLKSEEFDLISYARILTRVQKENGIWKIMQGDCIYERDELISVFPGEKIAINREKLNSYRASYKGLSYVLSLTGEKSDQELPGEDKPETIEKLYDEASSWIFN
ncbi:hypothetical protein D3Y79_15135 [Listeria monocytogenes]|nr:hypothetical protein [Listeria monocytogenes]EAH0494275.1 hypothetical protein [Listeria monocytogenes]EGQ1129677.1 hypothetical protein [Listeria monocytogenes]